MTVIVFANTALMGQVEAVEYAQRVGADRLVTGLPEPQPDDDLLVFHFASWVNEEWPLALAERAHLPPLIWISGKEPSLVPLSGPTAFASTWRLRGGRVLTAWATERSELAGWERAARTLLALRGKRLGSAGVCPGMLDAAGCELLLGRLGLVAVPVELEELLSAYAAVDDAAATTAAETVLRGSRVDLGREDALRVGRWGTVVQQVCERHRLNGLGVRCWPEIRAATSSCPCLPLAHLRGGACEGDLNAAATLLLMDALGAGSAFYADLGSVIGEDLLRLWHLGSAPFDLADGEARAVLDHGMRPHACFPLRPGRVTLVKLTRSGGLFVAGGEAVPTSSARGNVMDVRTDVPARQLVTIMLERGVEHHLIAAYGDHTEGLRKVAALAGLELTEQ